MDHFVEVICGEEAFQWRHQNQVRLRCYESCHDYGLIALSLVNDRPYVKRMTERGAEASKIDTQ